MAISNQTFSDEVGQTRWIVLRSGPGLLCRFGRWLVGATDAHACYADRVSLSEW